MNYKTAWNCPFCDSELWVTNAWWMSPEWWKQMKDRHDGWHKELITK